MSRDARRGASEISSRSIARGFLPVLAVMVLAAAGAAAYALAAIDALNARTDEKLRRNERRFERLSVRARFDTERTSLLRGLREAIPQLRPGVRDEDAARYARLVLDASEKYRNVDPVLLVSVGIVESGFNADAISHAGARGLYQITPPTGRLLARALGWEYSDTLLHDPVKNTEMAATYLGLLGTAYKDVEMMLAEYNGGPLNAGYFRAKAEQLAEETKNYVPRVLGVYERLSARLRAAGAEAPRVIAASVE